MEHKRTLLIYKDWVAAIMHKDPNGNYIRIEKRSWPEYLSEYRLKEIDEFEFKYVSSQEVRIREKALNERVKDFEHKLELQKITAYGNKITVMSIIQAVLNIKQRRIEGFQARINPIPTFLPGGIISDLALCAEQGREMFYNALGVPVDMMKPKYMGLTNNLPEMLKKMNKPKFRMANGLDEFKSILRKRR